MFPRCYHQRSGVSRIYYVRVTARTTAAVAPVRWPAGRRAPYTAPMRDATAAPGAAGPASPLPAVILAAGFGSRLEHAAGGAPKALVHVAGRPLLGHTLAALAGAGVREACIVTGHRAAEVERAISAMDRSGIEVSFARNPRPELPNASSLAAARGAVAGRPFLLLMADHLLSREAIAGMLYAAYGCAVGIDRTTLPPERLAEATKVAVGNGGLVTAFGKALACYSGVDTGIFRCRPSAFAMLDRLGPNTEISTLMTAIAAREPFHTVDLTGAFWLDVDTPEDLADAEALLATGV